MHIPENYLSPATCAVMTAAMVPVWTRCVIKVKKEIPRQEIPMLGVGAAFSFLAMMFNVPMAGGTTGHAVGGTLLAILFGPEAAALAVSIALLLQALFFGDGGVLAFGANCFNMAFVLPFVGFAIYSLIRKHWKSEKAQLFAAAIGAYIGINLAALCAAVEFGIQPILFHNAQGQALYCPYPLWISVPAMMVGHLTVFGIVEVIFTVAVCAYLRKTAPDLFTREHRTSAVDPEGQAQQPGKRHDILQKGITTPVMLLLVALILLSPLGLLATGTAWGEWGMEEIAAVTSGGAALGYTPAGMRDGFTLSVLFPDYAISGLPGWIGYMISAIIGAAILVIVFKLFGTMGKKKNV